MILPNISSVDFTEETSTSTTRLVFSSMTLDMTMPLNRTMNMYRAMARTIETIMYTSLWEMVSLPSSSTV